MKKTMPAPEYFLEIWKHKGPAQLKIKQMGIAIKEGQNLEELFEKFKQYTLSQIEEIVLNINLFESAGILAWCVFRSKNFDNEFGQAQHLSFNERDKTIQIDAHRHVVTGGIMDEVRRILNKNNQNGN